MKQLIILSTLLISSFFWMGVNSKAFSISKLDRMKESANRKVFTSISPDDKMRLLMSQKLCGICILKPETSKGTEWTVGMKQSIFNQVKKPQDSHAESFIKKLVIENIVDSAVSRCCSGGLSGGGGNKLQKQDEGDDVLEGVQGILTNLLSGDLLGIIRSSVGIGSPEWADTLSFPVTDVLDKLLGNIANAQTAINKGTVRDPDLVTTPSTRRPATAAAGSTQPVVPGTATQTRPVASGSGVGGMRPITILIANPNVGSRPGVGAGGTRIVLGNNVGTVSG